MGRGMGLVCKFCYILILAIQLQIKQQNEFSKILTILVLPCMKKILIIEQLLILFNRYVCLIGFGTWPLFLTVLKLQFSDPLFTVFLCFSQNASFQATKSPDSVNGSEPTTPQVCFKCYLKERASHFSVSQSILLATVMSKHLIQYVW